MLTTLLLIPFIGGLVLLLLPASVAPVRMRSVAIVVLSLQLLLSVDMSDRVKSAMGQITLVFKEKISMETSLKNYPMEERVWLGCF